MPPVGHLPDCSFCRRMASRCIAVRPLFGALGNALIACRDLKHHPTRLEIAHLTCVNPGFFRTGAPVRCIVQQPVWQSQSPENMLIPIWTLRSARRASRLTLVNARCGLVARRISLGNWLQPRLYYMARPEYALRGLCRGVPARPCRARRSGPVNGLPTLASGFLQVLRMPAARYLFLVGHRKMKPAAIIPITKKAIKITSSESNPSTPNITATPGRH